MSYLEKILYFLISLIGAFTHVIFFFIFTVYFRSIYLYMEQFFQKATRMSCIPYSRPLYCNEEKPNS